MKQTIELMNNIAIPVIKQRIAEESEWLKKLQNDDTAATIIEYREYKADDYHFTNDELKLDELCEEYFDLYTQYMDISLKCNQLQSNFTGEKYVINEVGEQIEPTEADLEDVELVSDEEILKIANSSENI